MPGTQNDDTENDFDHHVSDEEPKQKIRRSRAARTPKRAKMRYVGIKCRTKPRRPAPQNVVDLTNFMTDFLDNLVSDKSGVQGWEAINQRLQQLAQKCRVNVREMYCGKCTFSTLSCWFSKTLSSKYGTPFGPTFQTTHASDCNPVCQAVALSWHHPDDDPGELIKHVFGDFTKDRLTDPDKWNNMLPPAGASVHEKQKRYEMQWKEMLTDPCAVVANDKLAWCYRHLDYCPVFDRISTEVGRSKGEWKAMMDSIEAGSLPEGKTQPKIEDVDVCFQKVKDPWHELKLQVGGTTCTDHSTYGRMEKDAGVHQFPFNVFCAEILVWRPLFWLTEIAGDVDVEMYRQRLGGGYDIFSSWLNPVHSGAGEKRPRLYCFGSCLFRTVFHGSQNQFDELTNRKGHLHACDYWIVSDEERNKYHHYKASKRGNCHPSASARVPLQDCLTGAQWSMLCDHRTKLCKNGDNKKCCDLHQNASFSQGGSLLPCLVTHADIIRLDDLTYLHPLEYHTAQGEAIRLPKQELGCFKCCIEPSLLALMGSRHNGPEKVIKLAGNGMSMVNAGEFLMYCISETEASSFNLI